MKYLVDKQEKYAVFSLQEANLNTLLAPGVKSEFLFLHEEGVANLILDLSDVEYVDSSGLSAILTGNRLWNNSGGSFVVTGIRHASVKRLIEISQLGAVLTIVPTVAEATDYIFMEELERELGGEEPSEG
jgi:anti-sigma B factor antagonist